MPSLRERKKQLTRELFISSALNAFAEKGYAAATIDDITTGVGSTRTTFYLHFTSKADLVMDIIRSLDDTFTGADDPPLTSVIERGSRDLIEAWLNLKFDQWGDARPYLLAAYNAAPAEPQVDEALQAWFEETTTAMVVGLDLADRFAPAERRIRCVLAFGQFEYLARHWLRVGWKVDREISHRMLTDSWCHLLA